MPLVTISGDVTLAIAGPSGGNRLIVRLLERTSGGAVIERAVTDIAIGENALPPYHFTLPAIDSSIFSHVGSTYSIRAMIALGSSISFQASKAYTPGNTTFVITLYPPSNSPPYANDPTETAMASLPATDVPTQIITVPTDTPIPPLTTSIAATTPPRVNTPTVVSPPDPGALAKAELDKLAQGRILYNPPGEMTIGKDVIIEARVTQDMAVNLTPGLQGPGAPIEEPLLVGPFMKAILSGDKDKFKITAHNSEEQLVGGSTFTQWTWDVVPLEAGDQALYLIVTVRIKIPGAGEEKRDILVKNTRIKVQVNPAYSLQKFVLINWQWLLTAIVIPLGIFGWNRWGKKKEPPAPVTTSSVPRPDAMLGTVEVAEQLNISTTAVRDLILSGALPVFYVGNQLRIKQQDIGAYLQRQKTSSKSDNAR
jgi:excisionase family DNA binding protein